MQAELVTPRFRGLQPGHAALKENPFLLADRTIGLNQSEAPLQNGQSGLTLRGDRTEHLIQLLLLQGLKATLPLSQGAQQPLGQPAHPDSEPALPCLNHRMRRTAGCSHRSGPKR
jgi:hypothetical protein